MARLKLTENEKLLLQRMTYSGGRAISINANKENDLLSKYNITPARLKSLCREKYLKEEKQAKGGMDVVFNSKGKNFVKHHYTERPPKTASAHHDRGLYKRVCELSKSELDSCMSVNEYRRSVDARVSKINTPDLVYYSDSSNAYQAIEIITINYKDDMIRSKIEWAEIAKMRISIIDIDGQRGGEY